MSAANLVRSPLPSWLSSWLFGGRACTAPGVFSALALALALGMAGCHKDPPRRARRSHAHPAPAAAAADPDPPSTAPAAPAPVPPPPLAAAAPPSPPPPAPPPPPPPAPAPSHHQLTVDRSVPSPSRPRPVAAAAPVPAAEPPVEYQAVNDKPDPSARCQGGRSSGERLSVQGVADNDVLNVREAPDKASAILGEIPPGATGVRGTPNRRRVGPSTWREVECGKLRGWVNERFLARDSGE